jgi:hypothetical protein
MLKCFKEITCVMCAQAQIPHLQTLLTRHASASDAQKRSMEHHQHWLKSFSQRLEDAQPRMSASSSVALPGSAVTSPQRARVLTDRDVGVELEEGGDDTNSRRGGEQQDIVIRLRLEK